MYKRILVPLDGSPSSEMVFPHLQPLAKAFDTEMILLQVIIEPTKEFSVTISPLSPPRTVRKQQTKVKTYLKKACAKLEEDGIRASYLIRQGGIAESILEVAGIMQADLIAMSTHGHSPARLLLLGSVTYQVVRNSSLPMLVVRPEVSDQQPVSSNETPN